MKRRSTIRKEGRHEKSFRAVNRHCQCHSRKRTTMAVVFGAYDDLINLLSKPYCLKMKKLFFGLRNGARNGFFGFRFNNSIFLLSAFDDLLFFGLGVFRNLDRSQEC